MTNVSKCDLIDAHVKLRLASERAAADVLTDVRVMDSEEGEPAETIQRYLHKGFWVDLLSGLKIMLLDNTSIGTRALTEGDGLVPEHYHFFMETILVISGEVIEHTTGRVYYPGMSYSHQPGERHSPEIHGLVMTTWHPPLPEAKEFSKKTDPVILHLIRNG